MQEQGSASHGWWSWLEGCVAYRDVSVVERESIVRHMIDNDILVEADARLMARGHDDEVYAVAGQVLDQTASGATDAIDRAERVGGQQDTGAAQNQGEAIIIDGISILELITVPILVVGAWRFSWSQSHGWHWR